MEGQMRGWLGGESSKGWDKKGGAPTGPLRGRAAKHPVQSIGMYSTSYTIPTAEEIQMEKDPPLLQRLVLCIFPAGQRNLEFSCENAAPKSIVAYFIFPKLRYIGFCEFHTNPLGP